MSELLLGQIRKLGNAVLSRSIGFLLGVISGIDHGQVLDEVGVSVGLLGHGGISLAMNFLEVLEHELHTLSRSRGKASGGSGSDSGKGNNLVDHLDFLTFAFVKM